MRGIRYFSLCAAIALSIGVMGARALAAPTPTFTYEGYLEDGSGPVGPGTAVNKNFTFEIWGQDSNGSCKLATQSLTLPVKDGNFSAEIGAMTYPGGLSGLTAVFDLNNTSIAGASSCTFNAADTSSRRYLQVYVEGHSMGQVDFTRAPVAMVAQTLQGYTPSTLVRVNPTAQVTQANVEQFYTVARSTPGNSVYYDGTNFVSYDPRNGAQLTAGSVGNAAISALDWAKLTGIPSNISQIAGLSCSTGQYLKYSGSSWGCAAISVSETDPTVAAYAKNAPGAGLTVNGSNQIVPDFGTSAGKVVQGNDSRLSDSRAPNGSASGDLSGTYPSPTVAKIQGRGVSVTAPADGQVLRYNNGSSQWEPYNLGIGDLKTNAGTPQFISASCAASQTLIWSSVTNTFQCTNIAINASQVSGLSITETDPKVGANTTNYLSKWNGSALVASGLNESGGNIGIGTSAPTKALDVQGSESDVWINIQNNSSAGGGRWPGLNIQNYMGSNITNSEVWLATSRGSLASPSPVLSGDPIGGISGWGQYDTTPGNTNPGAYIYFYAGGNFSASSTPGEISLQTTPIGSMTTQERMRITQAGRVGIGTDNPSAQLDVAGTINATAMTINGVPVGTSTGMTSLNGSSQAAQTFATPGVTGLAPNWNTNAGTGAHTLNIPMANTASVTAGLISKTEYDNFNNKLGTATNFGGDVSGTYSGISVNKLKGVAVSATAPTSGQVLTYNSGTSNWVPSAPTVDAANVTGTLPIASGGTGQTTANAAFNALAPTQTSMSGKFLTTNGTNASWATALTAETDPKVGANTTNALSKWNGTALVTSSIYDSSGKIGIGSATPSTSLDVGSYNDAIAIPKGTTAQRPSSPSNGFVRYNSDLKGVEAYVNGGWQQIASGGSPTASEDGKSLRWNDSTKQFEWFTAGISGAGISVLNGSTMASQSFGIPGTTGTAPNWSTASGVHTLNIPMASTASVSAGLLANSDYTTFSNKLGAVSNTASLADSKIWIGDGTGKAQEKSLSGDVSLTNAGAVAVNKIKGVAVSATPTWAGQVLRYDGTNFTPNFVALTDLRSTVTGTNAFPNSCSNNQTLTYNSVGDIMGCSNISLPAGQVTGTLSIANGGTGASTQQGAINALLPAQTGNSAKVLSTDGTNVQWVTAGGGGSGILNATQNAQLNNYFLSGDGGNEGLKVDASGNIGTSGTVGVGTLTPSTSFKLDVNGNSILRDDVLIAKSGAPTFTMRNAVTPSAIDQLIGNLDFSTDAVTTAQISALSSQAHGTYRGSYLKFSTTANNTSAPVERMRIDHSGNVGIGTVAPYSPLSVSAGSSVQAPGASATGTVLHVTGPDGGSAARILVDAFGATTQSSLTLRSSRGTPASPVALQASDVGGAIAFKGFAGGSMGYSSSVGSMSFKPTENWTDTANGTAIQFQTTRNGTVTPKTAMMIDHNGGVGIGTTTPAHDLDIFGNTSTYTGAAVRNYTSGGQQALFRAYVNASATETLLGVDSGEGIVGTASASNLNIVTGGNSRITVQSGGNVGIGTDTPGTKLDVNGSVKLGSTGTVISGLGTCTLNGGTPFTASAGQNAARACNGVAAGAPIFCSPGGAQGSGGVGTWSAYASSANNVVLVLSIAGSAATWKCSYVNP